MQNAISWRDYEGVDGFGSANEEDLSSLLKALVAGNDQNAPAVAPGVGFPLRIESLERTLRNTTYRMEHIKLFKLLPKLAAYNTVEEYNQIQEYGQGIDAFIGEGDLPEETDATYERKISLIKYMGTTRKVSHVMSLVKPAHGNVIAQETVNGTMYLLRQIERSLFFGDSNLDPIQWDGFERLITTTSPAANIIDMRGAALNEDVLVDSAMTIQDAPNFGTPTHFFLNPKVKADLVKTFFPRARYDQFQKTDTGLVGLDIRGFTSPAGDVMFEADTFITDGGFAPTAQVGNAAKLPGSPSITVALAAAPAAGSLFVATDAGAYRYRIVAANRFGKSASVVVTGSPVAVAAGDGVTFTVMEAAGNPTAWYEVYRSPKNGAASSEKLIARVKRTAAAQVITDLNATLPGTTIGIVFQMNNEAVSFKQLAPMVKIPLATIDTSIRWMQLIYGVPTLYTPGKIVLIRNIGRSPDFKGQP
jgi:hypothetical protein